MSLMPSPETQDNAGAAKPRRTKIIATLGPATDAPGMLEKIILSGVDLVRVNLSHGVPAAHASRIEAVRSCALQLQREVGILIDLQGPKIRIARFKEGSIYLKIGSFFSLDASLGSDEGTEYSVGIDYKNLPKDVVTGDILLLDDGLIMLEVIQIQGDAIKCLVKLGGKLSNNKGINRKGGGLTAESLTEKDKHDIIFAAQMEVDYVAISFPRSAQDVEKTRELLEAAGSKAGVIAKVERVEAILAIEEIIKSADAVMVARGDLGVEIGYAELPAVQKNIIARARALDRAVITATQMMESMVSSPLPTRAEVSDVANAVLDGTDAVMLSAETATGDYPDKAVSAMSEICLAAERQKITQVSNHRLECQFQQVDEAIAMAAMYTANHIKAAAIVALTESGSTPLWMSRIRSGISIYGLSRHKYVRGRMTLYRGVYPINFDVTGYSKIQMPHEALAELVRLNVIRKGERIIMTESDTMDNEGDNTLKIITV
jgi:pyruvate kinase